MSHDSIDINHLPLVNLTLDKKEQKISFTFKGKSWAYDIITNNLDNIHNPLQVDPSQIISPNGKWAAYLKDHNLFIREMASNNSYQFTFDGSLHFAFTEPTESNTHYVTNLRSKLIIPPAISWSPDSKKILTYQLDEREVKPTYLLQMIDTDESLKPRLFTYKYPVPGDSIIPVAFPVVLNVEIKTIIRLMVPPVFITVFSPLDDYYKRIW